MITYNVYEQLSPIMNHRREWEAVLRKIGRITSNSPEQALKDSSARFLIKNPVLHELNEMGDEK